MPDFARSDHAAVQAQLDRLARLSPGGDRLGLDRISRLLERLGRPQDQLPPALHVAGTNGKGSTCAFLRSMLEAAGLRVHMFTSPHLVRFNERIRISGELVTDEELAALLEEVLDSAGGIEPSFFEVTTAAAFLAFSRHPADACVIEVGLGGRLDATNVIESPLVCGIAGLGLDHRQWLGRTLGDIAAEKAGIAKRGSPLVTQLYPPAPAERVRAAAEAAGAPWIARGEAWDSGTSGKQMRYRDEAGALDLPLPRLPGRHQADNAALAAAMIRHQHRLNVPDRAIGEGMIAARWPARLQKLGPGPLTGRLPGGSQLWVDGGHNGAAARLVAGHVRRCWQGDLPLTILFASLASKDPEAILRPFRGLADHVLTLPIEGHDARAPDALAELATRLGFQARACGSIEQALQEITAPSRVLVFGSLYLAGQAVAANGELPD